MNPNLQRNAVLFPPTTNAPTDGTFIKLAAGKSWYWDGLCWVGLCIPAPPPTQPSGAGSGGTTAPAPVGAVVSTIEPAHFPGRFWLNTMKSPPELRVSDGSQWLLSVPIDDTSITDDYGPLSAGRIDEGTI